MICSRMRIFQAVVTRGLAILCLALMSGMALATDATESAYKGGEVISLTGILQMATGLVLVLILIFGVAWFAKRFGRFQGASTGNLRMLGGLHLGQRERIVMVQADDSCLIIGVSPGCIRTLHVMPVAQMQKPVVEGESAPASDSFLNRFNREIRKRMQS